MLFLNNRLNLVHFIRGSEPRDRALDLALPVQKQIALMQKYRLPGTFLLQYNALEREDIITLLRDLDPGQFELGIWLEMCQTHALAAGLPWRGRPGMDWDWRAYAGFSVGYAPAEREALIDAVFQKFRQVFGREAQVIGTWMIDAHSLSYLESHYAIAAACICKDQWGTDGYTLWGGYWNQAYYPSRKNAFAPAQQRAAQISIPVFRMLGSDPVVQYDMGLRLDEGAPHRQQVASLEPVYPLSGGNEAWVQWFMAQNFSSAALGFSYAQAGQENSFGWPRMGPGLEMQLPLFAAWRREGRLQVEPLGETGRWFRRQYALTPPTSVCALAPFGQRQAQSIWFDCKAYRLNLYGDASGIRIRDLFCFDQDYPERYLAAPCQTDAFIYDNLPIMDGNRMSGRGVLAGGWLTDTEGQPLAPAAMTAIPQNENRLLVSWPGQMLVLTESSITLRGSGCLLLRWLPEASAFTGWEPHALRFSHHGHAYFLAVSGFVMQTKKGLLLCPDENGLLRLTPRRQGE